MSDAIRFTFVRNVFTESVYNPRFVLSVVHCWFLMIRGQKLGVVSDFYSNVALLVGPERQLKDTKTSRGHCTWGSIRTGLK